MGLGEAAIRPVAATRPALFYYKVDARARRGIRVVQSDCTLDSVRPAARTIIRISRQNYVEVIDLTESFDNIFCSVEPVRIRYLGEDYRLVDFSTPPASERSRLCRFRHPLSQHDRAIRRHPAIPRFRPA